MGALRISGPALEFLWTGERRRYALSLFCKRLGLWDMVGMDVWLLCIRAINFVFGWLTELRAQVQIFPFKSAIRQGL